MKPEQRAQKVRTSIAVVWQNEHFMAVDKPAGWLTVPGRVGAADARPCVREDLARRGAIWPVHRLDVEVSGLLLFARDVESHRAANGWFAARQVHKLYEAWSEGEPAAAPHRMRPGKTMLWRARLLRGKRRAYLSRQGKPALTRATWLGPERFKDRQVQRWLLEALTGRPHQLRFELSRRGFPIVGDALYGARSAFASGAIALRAVKLDLADCPDAAQFGLPLALEVQELRHSFDL